MPLSRMSMLVFAALCAGKMSARAQTTPDLPAAPGPAPLTLPKATGPIVLYELKPTDVPPALPPPTEEESWCSAPSDFKGDAKRTMTPAKRRARELYGRAVMQQIYSNWKIPRAANDPWLKGASVRIRFTIDRNGTIVDPAIMMSSGRRVYDLRALDGVKNASPLSPPPAELESPVQFCTRFYYNQLPPKTDSLPDPLPDPFAAKPRNPQP